jgi:transposase InsO family protein
MQRIEVHGWEVSDAAKAAGISVRRSYCWLARYRAGGEPALADRRSAPHHCKHSLDAERIGEIERLRRQRMSGPAIAGQLKMPVSTVGAVLRRRGLGKLATLDPRAPAVRYPRERPGELIHIDIKKLGRIDGVGHRITGDRRDGRGIGWEHVHVCIDDASRLAYSEMMADEKKESAVAFLERAVGWFAGHGVVVERVMTDNGSAYRSRLWRQACEQQGMRHLRTKPYTPRTNGKAERFIQTSLREWAYARPYASSQERHAALARWLRHYNTQRPHTALAQRPPITRLKSPLLGSAEGTVALSRPAFPKDHGLGAGQGSPQATGDSRRAASLPRPEAAVTLEQGGNPMSDALNNLLGNDS